MISVIPTPTEVNPPASTTATSNTIAEAGPPLAVGATANNELFSLRKPDELVGMEFDDSDIILGDRLIATGQSCVIAGAGGIGKSRLIVMLSACVVTGRKFFTLPTSGERLRWLILQTENTNRRLQADLLPLRQWLGKDDWKKFSEHVTFHTIETDVDCFVSLDDTKAVSRIQQAIKECYADVVVFDPLNSFGIGDLNKDHDMITTLRAISRICRAGNPNRTIIVLHHALTGRAGAQKAVGFDRSSFARNSKALLAWTRGQINVAPVDGDSNARLIMACGKCSNGCEFPPFGIKLNPSTMVYEQDGTTDISEWDKSVNGTKNNRSMPPADVALLCGEPKSKKELVAQIVERTACAASTAYKIIDRAVAAKTVTFLKQSKKYAVAT